MGLFINRDVHGSIYKNEEQINEPNQGYFKWDPLSELLKEQKKVNDSLHHSFLRQHRLSEQQEYRQTNRWQEVSKQLTELNNRDHEHEAIKNHVLERLKGIDEDNKKLQGMVEQERLSEREMREQVTFIGKSNQAIAEQLEMGALANEQIGMKMDEQHNQLAAQWAEQKGMNEDVLNRLEKQEAVTEKISRQMDYFRSILYERTTYLAEKIEESYHLTSNYVTQLITGSDQPAPVVLKEKKREEQKSAH